jgi:hypothetical protein
MTSIWIDDVVVGEKDGFADFVIRLDAPTSAPLTVNYSTANSTARLQRLHSLLGHADLRPRRDGQNRLRAAGRRRRR